MNLLSVKIETPHLSLIPISEQYAQCIFDEFTEEITRYMTPKPAKTIEETLQFIASSIRELKDGTTLQLIAIKKENSEFVGCIGLHNIGLQDPELGLWIKKSAHGNAYGLEAVTALIAWARANINFAYLRYPVDKQNYASRRIPERNGGIIMKEYSTVNQSGIELDEVEYWIYR